ncbi:MAG: hypothetical protein H0W83_05180, partial [Planctomycetes bacterium]|nr:hypothetical protein [Planctomycetota bacterium]
FMEARAAELRAIAAAKTAIPLAQAWARRLGRPRADEESGLPSLHLAIAVAIEDRALAGTLSAHATDLLEEAWYPQEFGELQRRLLLSLEIEQLPGDLRTPLRRILAGLRPQFSGRDRQRILLHLGRMPHSAVMTHLQTENPEAWADLHKRGTGAVIGIAAVIALVVAASIGMLAMGHSPFVIVMLGVWILRVMRGGSIGLTTSIGAHPAGWLTGLTGIGALIAFTSPWNLGVAGAAIVIYAITRLVPSLRRLLITHLLVHARTQADLRLLLVAAGAALAITHLVARWPQLAAAPSAPFGGALLATAAFLLMAMFASSRPRGWARVLTAAETPLEPRPLAIFGLLAAGTLVVIWIAASLPGWWSGLGDLALVPALIAVHHGTVAAWRQQWHVRFRVMLYALGIVAAASALIWLTAVVADSARNAPPRTHQQAPMRVRVGQELPRVEVFYAQAIAASLKKDWEAHHPERIRLRLASVINPRSNRSNENAWSIADKLLSDRSLPEGLVMLCLDRLDVLTADHARARIVHAMKDPRPAIAEHARSLEAAHDARSAPAVPEMPPAVPRPEPARTAEPESRMPP